MKAPKARDERYSSNERILDLMLSFGQAPDGRRSAQALAKQFGLSRSSTYRYLQILRARALVAETDVPGEYEIGAALIALGDRSRRGVELDRLAAPLVDRLAAATGEAVMLTCRQGDRVVVIAARESAQMVRISIEPARNLPLHVGSPAKIHLAHLPEHEIDRIVEAGRARRDGRGSADGARLRLELAQIRRRGYAESEGEIESGVCSLSVPVFDGDGDLIAGLTVAGPSFRLKRSDRRRILAQLGAMANELAEAVAGARSAAAAGVAPKPARAPLPWPLRGAAR